MKNLKLLAALLALAIGLAGCGSGSSTPSSNPENMLDGDNMIASPSAKQEYTEPEDVTYMRLLAGEDEYRACVLYLGGSYEITTDVQKVLDSQTDLRELWGFVYDIPQDHWVVAPDGGCDLYCIFPQDPDATLFVEEAALFYQEGTPEVPFRSNQEWYATFTGPHGDRYAITLEDEDTLALKVYLDGQESYLSLVNTVYFARQEAMG